MSPTIAAMADIGLRSVAASPAGPPSSSFGRASPAVPSRARASPGGAKRPRPSGSHLGSRAAVSAAAAALPQHYAFPLPGAASPQPLSASEFALFSEANALLSPNAAACEPWQIPATGAGAQPHLFSPTGGLSGSHPGGAGVAAMLMMVRSSPPEKSFANKKSSALFEAFL